MFLILNSQKLEINLYNSREKKIQSEVHIRSWMFYKSNAAEVLIRNELNMQLSLEKQDNTIHTLHHMQPLVPTLSYNMLIYTK